MRSSSLKANLLRLPFGVSMTTRSRPLSALNGFNSTGFANAFFLPILLLIHSPSSVKRDATGWDKVSFWKTNLPLQQRIETQLTSDICIAENWNGRRPWKRRHFIPQGRKPNCQADESGSSRQQRHWLQHMPSLPS